MSCCAALKGCQLCKTRLPTAMLCFVCLQNCRSTVRERPIKHTCRAEHEDVGLLDLYVLPKLVPLGFVLVLAALSSLRTGMLLVPSWLEGAAAMQMAESSGVSSASFL